MEKYWYTLKTARKISYIDNTQYKRHVPSVDLK